MLTLRKRGRNFHIRGSVRIGQKIEVVQEHSTGTSSRPLAEAYRVKLEGEIQHRLLHGTAGRASQLSIAAAPPATDTAHSTHRAHSGQLAAP